MALAAFVVNDIDFVFECNFYELLALQRLITKL